MKLLKICLKCICSLICKIRRILSEHHIDLKYLIITFRTIHLFQNFGWAMLVPSPLFAPMFGARPMTGHGLSQGTLGMIAVKQNGFFHWNSVIDTQGTSEK